MKGPLRRISLRRRPAEPVPQETQPTMVAPPVEPAPTAVAEPLPAGLAPEDVAPSRPSFRDRGRLRRRLRYLRRVRELGFRDLGGLAFDLHRFQRRNDELVLGKLAALDAVDRELREPGVAACPRCGALHGSDAKYCPQCGTQFSGPLAMVEVGGVATPAPEASPYGGGHAAQQPTAVSSPELGSTPVSGALEGNPPAEAPPAPPPEAPTTVADAAPADQATDQSTQALPALGDDVPNHAEANGSSSVTGGDPLAQRERPES